MAEEKKKTTTRRRGLTVKLRAADADRLREIAGRYPGTTITGLLDRLSGMISADVVELENELRAEEIAKHEAALKELRGLSS